MIKHIFCTLIFSCFVGVSFAQTNKIIYVEEEPTLPKQERTPLNPHACGGASEPLRVVGFVNYPPFGWVEGQKQAVTNFIAYTSKGIAYDLFLEVIKDYPIVFKDSSYPSYKQAQSAVRYGAADLMLGTYYDNDPYVSLDTVYPAYLSNPFVVVSLKGTLPPVTELSQLAGKRGVVRTEEMIWPLMQPTFPADIPMTEVSGARNAFNKLIKKEADFLLTSLYAAEAEMRRFKIVENMDVSETVFRHPNIFFAFSPVGDCGKTYKAYFKKRLTELTADKDFMRALVKKNVEKWEKKFESEPILISAEGQKMTDETAVKADLSETAQTEKSANSQNVIQQQMEKMHVPDAAMN